MALRSIRQAADAWGVSVYTAVGSLLQAWLTASPWAGDV